MKKKLLAAMTVGALAVSMIGTTAFAAETNEFEGVAAGTYEVEASLYCYMNAMGGADLGKELLDKAELVVEDDGDASIKLTFNPDATWSTAYFSGQPAYVDVTGDTQYWDGTAWVDADVAAGAVIEVTSMSGATSSVTIADTMTFPVDSADATYDLAMNVSGTQFGGANKAVLSNGSACEAVLSVTWSEDLVGGDNTDDDTVVDNDTTDNSTTDKNDAVTGATTNTNTDADTNVDTETDVDASADTDSDTSADTSESPTTADSSMVGFMIVICVAAVAAAGTVFRRKMA